MPYFRITDKGAIERAAVVEAIDAQAAREEDIAIPKEEAEVNWVERIVEEISEDEFQSGGA